MRCEKCGNYSSRSDSYCRRCGAEMRNTRLPVKRPPTSLTLWSQAAPVLARGAALVALGVSIFDNLDFERLAEEARRLHRYEFLLTAAPLRIEQGMGSPINPIATF